ncbi:hypothetical protein UAY_03172 [Enterococcus moraviensis ATCC BAA-383]|uniref:Uncharacterized protein n=1 Tax=Enterococcus moraviensis ATCC BAA-383 TaxID=1158609 RepID=R2SSH4_9ENTE|nr:hypothetical protein [Enterococcus moraviensis]EOH95746.1 hypothetical protein UAY_03172 [Enterococcus moraviensis ATCC BAA-383]EOT66233.1 hypothetical protein I586_02504 [Enterococcus moraviensis ATCC BAA-383]
MKKKQITSNYLLYILIFGFILEIILKDSYPRLGTLIFNCVLGITFIVSGWRWDLKRSWLARIVFSCGVLWLGYLFLYYVTGFNNHPF